MKKICAVVLPVFILVFAVSGCAPELYERLLIRAVGVDSSERGCRVTVLASETTEEGGQSTFSAEGKTVPEALGYIALMSGREPLYAHNTAVVFGMDCAEKGISDTLDFFIRHYDARPTAKVYLASETAKSALTQTDFFDRRFVQLSGSAKYSGLSVDTNVLQLVNGLYGLNRTAVLPVLGDGDSPELIGTAILQSNRLCAVLTPEETQGLCALRGTLYGGAFTVRDEAFGTVSLKVRHAESKVEFDGTEDNPKFTVEIQIDAEVSSVSDAKPYVQNDAFPRFEAALSEKVRQCAMQALQAEGAREAAGLRETALRSLPNTLLNDEEKIAECLSEAEIEIAVRSNVQRVEEENIPYL